MAVDQIARGLAASTKSGLSNPSPGYGDSFGRISGLQGWFGREPLGKSVMASPPTITTGSATSMSSPFSLPAAANSFFPLFTSVSDRIAYSRGSLDPTARSSVVAFNNVTANAAGTVFAGVSFGASFVHYGSVFELVFGASTTGYLIRVDDQYVTLTPLSTGASGQFFAKYDFGSAAQRRIDIIGWNISLNGVNIAATDSLDIAPIRGPKVIILGDSFTAAQPNGFTTAFSDQMGWDDVWASGVGGTGYVANNSGASQTYGQRAMRDVVSYAPDIVFVVGSVNDDGLTVATVATAASSLYSYLRSALPKAMIFAGPTASGGVNRYAANKLAIKAATKSAAAANGVIWLDPLEMPLLNVSGSPNIGTLKAAFSAGLAGSTGIWLSGTLSGFDNAQGGSVIEIGSGATLERLQLKTGSQVSAGIQNWLFDGALQYAHASGEAWTQVGSSYLTGKGNTGATTGFGNSDLYVSADATHPTTIGYTALGRIYATLMRRALRASYGFA